MAALAYPFWFVLFPLIYMTPDKRNDPFLREHSFQGAVIGFGGVFGLTVLRTVLSIFVRWFVLFDLLLFPLLKILEWGVLALLLYGAFGAYSGKSVEIPFVSSFVRSLTKRD